MLTFSGVQASTCSPQAQEGLADFSKRYIKFLCFENADCLQKAQNILKQSLDCVDPESSVKEWRKQATAFMRDESFKQIIESRFLQDDPTGIRRKIWEEFEVLVLPGGLKTPTVQTLNWKEVDLQLLWRGYQTLKTAIANAVGYDRLDEFSHIWGAGGSVARGGEEMPGLNQLGEVWNIYPLQMNVVVSLSDRRFTANEVAQRIAHENAHSQDYLLGAFRNEFGNGWSETTDAQIFHQCELRPAYETELTNCWELHPEWFSFHPSKNPSKPSYASKRAAEFYSKMIDEWVRENLGLVKKPIPYRCQSPETLGFWREMEKQFLGEIFSNDCKF